MCWWIPLAFLFLASFQESESAESEPEAPVQPIAFSHRRHLEFGLTCRYCHNTVDSQAAAGIPQVDLCMSCHRGVSKNSAELKKLLAYADSEEEIPWVRVYQLPYFVFFHHGNHSGAGVECVSCHGPVEKRDVLWREGDISMDGCIQCHSERGTSIECHLCHELNQ